MPGDIVEETELRQLHLRCATGAVRVAKLQGRDHIVVPVIALMEGVIHAVNASTPEFVPESTLIKAAASWNGRPVVLRHPVKAGRQCSANSPDVMDSHGIGTIFNSRVEGKKLHQEAWIDKEKLFRLHPDIHNRMLAGQRAEVSVGAFVQADGVRGIFNGKTFLGSWREATGDHLAFLPEGRGACSIEMGCGAMRAAEEAGPPLNTVTDDAIEIVTEIDSRREDHMPDSTETITHLGGEGSRGKAKHVGFNSPYGMAPNEADKKLKALKATDEEVIAHDTEKGEAMKEHVRTFVEDIRAATSVDEVVERILAKRGYKDCPTCESLGSVGGNPCPTCDGKGKLRVASGARNSKSDLSVIQTMHDHAVSLGAACEAETVRTLEDGDKCDCEGTADCPKCDGTCTIKTTKLPAEQRSAATSENPETGHAGCGCKPEGVSSMTSEQKSDVIKTLVSDKHSGFTAGDERMLAEASDERLESFRVAAESRKTQEQELRAAAAKQFTPEEFMAAAPPELKALIERQQENETNIKADLVTQLRAAQSEYSDAELSVMPVNDLTRLARLTKVDNKIDFSGRGIPRALAEQKNEDYAPPNPYAAGMKALQN